MTIAAWMHTLQYDLQSSAAKDNSITHAAAAASNLEAAIPMRSATGDSKTPYNYAHTQPHPKQLAATVTMRQKKNDKPTAAATVAHTRYLSSSPAATLHGKTLLRLPPQNKAHETFMQPLQCGSQHQLANLHLSTHRTTPEQQMTRVMQPFQCDLQPEIPKQPLTTHTHTQPHPKQLQATVTLRQKKTTLYTEKHKVLCSGFLPNSPLPFLTASHRHHFPSSPPPFVHFPSSPLPFLTTSHRPHLPSSPFPFIITSHRHHFPSSPLPFVTTSLRHHFPSSTSLRHRFPSSPFPFVTTSLRHHPSLSPPFIKVNSTASYSFVMYCYVMYCYVIYHPASCQVAEFYLSVTRKYCFPTSFEQCN